MDNPTLQKLRCPKCFTHFDSQPNLKTLPFTEFEGASEIVIVCPDCERQTHVAFTNARLHERGQILEKLISDARETNDPELCEKWRRRQRTFKRDFDIFNKKVARRLDRGRRKARA